MRTDRLVVLACVAAVGCAGDPPRVPVAAVQGKLFAADGRPAVGAVVSFHPTGDTTMPFTPFGTVGADGTFTLTSYAGGDGTPAGTFAVTVVWRGGSPDGDGGGVDKLKGKYADPAKPLATVTVPAGGGVIEPFRLK